MKKSIKLNGILNVIKKCCNIILPLLVFPYISRVLGPDNYGKFSCDCGTSQCGKVDTV